MTMTVRRFVFGALFACALLVLAASAGTPALADADLGVRAGAYADADAPFFGGEVLFNLGDTKRWFGNPNLEHAFAADDRDLTTVSFDFHYDFDTRSKYTVWAGGGPTVIFRDHTGSDGTDPGVNLLLGVGAMRGDVRPYGQFKVIVADDSQAVLAAGVRF